MKHYTPLRYIIHASIQSRRYTSERISVIFTVMYNHTKLCEYIMQTIASMNIAFY